MHITVPMFEKGRSFVMAGGLVKAYGGHRFVNLHLLCQGLECIGKALLLDHDYEKYEPIIKTHFSHDLELLVAEINKNAGRLFLSSQSSTELKSLNAYYKCHMLRYGNNGDFNKESLQVTADHIHGNLVNCLTEWNERFSTNNGDS